MDRVMLSKTGFLYGMVRNFRAVETSKGRNMRAPSKMRYLLMIDAN